MPVQVKTHNATDSIIVVSWPDGSTSAQEDLRLAHEKARTTMQSNGWSHAYIIYDITGLDLTLALTELQSDDATWLREHVTVVLIGSPEIVEVILAANSQEQYGGATETYAAASLDEALVVIEKHRAA